MRSAWAAAAAEQPRVASGGTLSTGDVLFFYTKRIHRAPPPPAARSPRYPLRRLLQAGQDGWAACGAGPQIEADSRRPGGVECVLCVVRGWPQLSSVAVQIRFLNPSSPPPECEGTSVRRKSL